MSPQDNAKIHIGFWGGHPYSLIVLEKLKAAGFTLSFIATSPDQPKGRNLVLTPPPAKLWGIDHGVPVLQPETLKDPAFVEALSHFNCDVFIVMAYGKILPENILNLPRGKSLNIHPSLLPKYRGSCPIESAILADDKAAGVTIILMDKEMDHGPIVAQQKVVVQEWPPFAQELGERLVAVGADLLVSTLPEWMAGKITPQEQDHARATYTKKIQKEDGLIDLNANPYTNYLKYKAYKGWPSVYFFEGNSRVKITQASYRDGKFVIEKVIREGKPESAY